MGDNWKKIDKTKQQSKIGEKKNDRNRCGACYIRVNKG